MATEMKMQLNAKEYGLVALTLTLIPISISELFGVPHMRAVIPAFQTKADEMPQPRDLLVAGTVACLIVALRVLCATAFKPLAQIILSPSKRVIEDRVERFTSVLFKFIFYLLITTVGYWILKEEKWLPTMLGGSDEIGRIFTSANTPPSQTLKYYFMVELGYHLHSLIYLTLLSPIRNDFIEMLLHHVATILLITSSFLANYIPAGALIVFLHDIGDVTGYLIKTIVDSGKTPLIVTAYVLLLISWAYTRLYVFPFHLIYHIMYVANVVDPSIVNTFLQPISAMLCILVLLHYYWFVLFLVMGFTLLFKGKIEDIQQKCSEEDVQEEEAVVTKKTQ